MRLFDFINKEISIVCGKTEKSYLEFKKDVLATVKQFEGVKKILLSEANSYEWIVVFFAILYAGKEIHILDINTRLQDFIEKQKYDLIITSKKLQNENNLTVQIQKLLLNDIELKNEISDQSSISTVLLYTTGTINEAKPIAFSVEQLLGPATAQGKYLGITQVDRIIVLPPFSHAYGLSALLSSMYYAKQLLVLKSPIDLLKMAHSKKIDMIFIPPVFLKILVKSEYAIEVLKSVRSVISAGSRIDRETSSILMNNGIPLVNMYGSTEAGMCFIGASRDCKNTEDLYLAGIMKKKIINGELLVKGDNIGKSFLDSYQITDEDGWYHTGDIVEAFGEQRFRIVGRKDQIYVLENGFKINVEKLENKIKEKLGLNVETQVLICRKNGLEQIVLVVEKNGKKPLELEHINDFLQYYEKIDQVIYVSKIRLLRGKKIRMNREYIVKSVKEVCGKLVKSEFADQLENFENDIPFFKQMGFDSIMSLQFIVEVENKLNLKFDFLKFDPLCTFEEMINFLCIQKIS